MKIALTITVALMLALPTMAQEPAGKISPRLEQALTQSVPGVFKADGTLGVWVHFTDKALADADLSAALGAAEQALPERTLRRRAKVKDPGSRLADTGDLPLAPEYLNAVTATGAQARKQSRWLNAASFNATGDQITAIADLPFVERVSLIAQFTRPGLEVSPQEESFAKQARDQAAAQAADRWSLDYGGSTAGLQQINVPQVHEMGLSGAGVVVGMFDSGFRTTHLALQNIPVLAQWDFVDDDPIVDEEEGDATYSARHGTQTLSTIMGFYNGELVGPAYQASVILARTEDYGSETPIEEDYWVAGLEWVESLGADLVSSSLGYYYWYEFSDMDGNTAVTTIATDAAVARGLGVFTSAGNERDNSEFPHIIAPADGATMVGNWLPEGADFLEAFKVHIEGVVPTYMGHFQAVSRSGGVELSFAINGSANASDFELVAELNGTRWNVPVTGIDSGFTASDNSPNLAQGGTVTYSLYMNIDGLNTLLETKSLELPVFQTKLVGASPNPFNPNTTVFISLGSNQNVKVGVYDLAGRHIADLANGTMPAGSHELKWDGKDFSGRAVASATYTILMESEDGIQTKKMSLVR